MKIKKNDLFIGIYLLSAVIFFIISIPSWLLDILLALNIAVALIILFNALYAKEVLDKIKNKTVKYDFVEVMSCPMGCVGGAGNKLSNINKLDEVRDMRKDLLNLFDSEMIVRNCFQNKEMMKLFNGYLNKERIKNYLHTSFSKKSLTK